MNVGKKRFTSKTYLKVLIVVGLLAVVGGGAGTFATFNAETTNSGNTFATGTLLLSDDTTGDPSGTICFSDSSSSNTGSGCTAIVNTTNVFTASGTNGHVIITNTGTLASSDLELWGSTCVNATVGTTISNFNTGDICGNVLFSLEQDTDNGFSATGAQCLVGGTGSHACDQTAGTPLGPWLASSASIATPFTFGGDSLTAGASRYYKLYLYLPDETNAFQGRSASFNLTWHIDQ